MQAAPGMEGNVRSGHGHSTAMLQICVCVLCSCRCRVEEASQRQRHRGALLVANPHRFGVCLQLVKSDASTEGAPSNLVMHLQRGDHMLRSTSKICPL